MRHCGKVTKSRLMPATSPLEMKYTSKLDMVNRLVLADRQSAWKVPFPIGYDPGTPTDGTDDETTPTV
ncbi:MAG TPA: hypothetical protein VMZ06_14775 [Candidatus Bathyarchaeia archaeon]|nr:hypothetical protein [Candidatus Bathyarchaeia archaeon]